MIVWGINALNHDASICVFQHGQIKSHTRASEFSGIRGDAELNTELIYEALKYGLPTKIFWYENPYMKKLRQLRAGQFKSLFNINELPNLYLKKFDITAPIIYTSHHHSHAAAGYYTSNFNRAAVVVLDAIGEFQTMSIWQARNRELVKLWSSSYPNSLGLFYSAFTDLIGLEPASQEHVLQQMSTKGDPDRFYKDVAHYFKNPTELRYNLHKGVYNWPYGYQFKDQDKKDLAAAVQQVFEEQVDFIMLKARRLTGFRNLVYMGGCAMNSLYNKNLRYQWRGIWSLPWPGDASSSIGAVLAHTKVHVPYHSENVVKHIELKYN